MLNRMRHLRREIQLLKQLRRHRNIRRRMRQRRALFNSIRPSTAVDLPNRRSRRSRHAIWNMSRMQMLLFGVGMHPLS